MKNFPKYICFEGLDGSGKSTVFEKSLKALRDAGYKVNELSPTHKLNENDSFEKIFAKYKFLNQSRFFRQFLYAHRSNKAADLIDTNCDLILGDRSIITSYVCRWTESDFQNKYLVCKVNFLESKIPAPDEVIYLNVPHEVLQKRLDLRGQRDIDETKQRSLEMRRAYEILYNTPNLIKRLENTHWHIINGNQSPEKVFNDVWQKLTAIIRKDDFNE